MSYILGGFPSENMPTDIISDIHILFGIIYPFSNPLSISCVRYFKNDFLLIFKQEVSHMLSVDESKYVNIMTDGNIAS